MRTTCFLAILVTSISNLSAQQVTLSQFGWTISADPAGSTLTIRHGKLGVILQNVRLHQGSDGTSLIADKWNASLNQDGQLAIQTADPRMSWLFHPSEDQLAISTTDSRGLITAQAPASQQRIVARLLDRQGTPVDWVGTGEVAVSYGGGYTHNASFLPRNNPECTYFALGQASAGGFHSLFDRPSDIAIDFPEDTSWSRNSQDLNLLDVRIPVAGNALIRLLPDYYTMTLGVPFYVPYDDSHFPAAPSVWSSWTSYYEQISEAYMVQNADWIATHLLPYGFQFVQLDDGYDRGPKGEHYWITRWDQKSFPHGPEWLARYIHSMGLRPGIWLVPNSHAEFISNHPDWYLYYKSGKPVFDYNTPALDPTNPAVLDLLKNEFSTIAGWGYEYFKIDGEHAIPKYVPDVDLTRLFDKSIDPLTAYRNRLGVIRKAIGPDSFIEGCIAGTPLNGIGYIDSFFNGHDLYDNWQGMYSLFSSINANTFFNHIVAYNMPGEGMALEPRISFDEGARKRNRVVLDTERDREFPLTGFGTTLPEARTVVSLVALTGVAYSIASVMPELPEERVELLQKTLPTMPIFPMDLFSRGTDMQWDRFKHTTPDEYIHNYPEIVDLKVQAPAGNYDVVAMTNWRTWPEDRDLRFDTKLGLDTKASYVAFDFWNQKIEGPFDNHMQVEISPHDTRVFQLHRLLNRPQLVGNSRHISGAHSVLKVNWDDSKQTLSGSVQSVAGAPYSLWIYVPDGTSVLQVHGSVEGNQPVPVSQVKDGHSLRLTFPGQDKPVDWQAVFFQNKP